MASYHGRGGAVTWTTLTWLDTNVHSWTVDLAGDAEETTAFGISAPYPRSYIPGLTGWSGSYECRADSTTYPTASDMNGTYQINLDTGYIHYKGSAIVTGIGTGVPVDGVPTLTVNFQGTGAITVSDA